MKMASQILSDVEGISIYPLISFIIFFAFFTGMLLYVFSRKKSEMSEMERFVLEEQDSWEKDKTTQF